MNIQPGKMRNERRRPMTVASGTRRNRWVGVAKVVTLAVAVAAFCNMQIYLVQKTTECSKNVRELKREINEVTNDNTLLRNRKETLSDWRHISSQIARFQLQLRPAMPGQVRSIQLYSPRQAAAIQLTPVAVTARRF